MFNRQPLAPGASLWATLRATLPFSLALPLLGAVLMLAFAPYDVIGRNLWGDEAFTASYTFHPGLGQVLEDVRKNEETPPLYFIIMWGWARVFGHGEVALRSFSLVCGVLTIIALARFVAPRLSRQAATFVVGAAALAPLLLTYLVEARAYAMAVLMVTLCTWAFEALRASPGRRALQLAYAATAAACFLTSYITLALLMAHWVVWLYDLRSPEGRGSRVGAWALIWALVGLVVLPWLPSLYYQVSITPEVTAKAETNLIAYYPRYLAVLMGHPLETAWLPLWMVGASAGYVLALLAGLVPRAGGGLALRCFVLTFVALAFLLNYLGLLWAKYALTLLPSLVVAIGVGYDLLRASRPRLGATLVALVLLTMVVANLSRYPYPHDRGWSQASQVVAENAAPEGDAVVMGWPADQRVFEYYYEGGPVRLIGARNFDDFYVGTGHSYSEGWRLDEVLAATSGARRIWIIKENYYSRFSPVMPYPLLQRWDFGRIKLELYDAAPR